MGSDAMGFLFWGVPIDDDVQPDWWNDSQDWKEYLYQKAGIPRLWEQYSGPDNKFGEWLRHPVNQLVVEENRTLKKAAESKYNCDMGWSGCLDGEESWFAYPTDLYLAADWGEYKPVKMLELVEMVSCYRGFYHRKLRDFFDALDMKMTSEPRWYLTANYG